MKRIEGGFHKWFIAQHGVRQHGVVSDRDLAELASEGKNAERILRDRFAWDSRYTSSLYAWQARKRLGVPAARKPRKGEKRAK